MLSRLWGAVRAAALLGTHSSAGPARGRAANRSDLDQAPMAVRQRAVLAQDVHRGAAVDPTAVAVDVAAAYLGRGAVADRGRTVVQAARDFEVSWPVAHTPC